MVLDLLSWLVVAYLLFFGLFAWWFSIFGVGVCFVFYVDCLFCRGFSFFVVLELFFTFFVALLFFRGVWGWFVFL